ncbi:MAG TPA: PP2C family protein-serine/threonine phosphatase [Acidobacteriaceae bacterium]|jgi:hypothetical protein|nr:PP2C family protein-serine/threonine phosphatase [Acidobacteriaceae bacterium]
MRTRILLALLFIGLVPAGVFASNVPQPDRASPDLAIPVPAMSITLGEAMVALHGPWKFHIGDSPRTPGSNALEWASPNFDDSQWETVDLTPKAGSIDPNAGFSGYVPGWAAKGHPGYWGYAWYRIRVRVTVRPGEKLALAGSADVDDAYQAFANGVLLGSFGKFPGSGRRPVVYFTQPRMFSLPQPKTGGSGSDGSVMQVLAFRVWMAPSTLASQPDAGGFHTSPLLGEANVVAAHYQLAWLELARGYGSTAIEAELFFLLALVACGLALFDRSDPVYLWLAAVLLLTSIYVANLSFAVWTEIESSTVSALIQDGLLSPLILGGWVMVWWVWFRLRHPAWMPKAIAVLTLLYALSKVLGEDLFFSVVPHSVSNAFYLASFGIRVWFLLLLVLIVVWGIRQQGQEGWLALPAVVLVGIAEFEGELGLLHVRTTWFPFGVQITLSQIADLALVAAMFALLLRRMLLSVRRQREMALDVKQAQEVQQVLIPEDMPQVPGLTIESEYRPAREVGGDFYQILPQPSDGSVLIVAGDVTGHGLQAGMLVAMLVGVIRTEAAHTTDPLEILDMLNRRLCGRGHAHATCQVLRITADGGVTLANAGHLPPYRNGEEVPMEGALPLGMLVNAEFSVMHFQLNPGDRLMMMSDGIAEAKNEHGELFGFERVNEMLQKPITAAELAIAAQNFGQEDDISVLSVTRTAGLKTAIA